ncbi:hypothetical protein C8T65DRAFT_268202 [Cerioporus squamosus]|nr:hypothetical protein C8T65DRAFT_268202 [Cerioporus squamosus]
MKFERLPADVLHLLAEHLLSVHDYRSLLLASPAFHAAVPKLSSRLLAILASRPASKGFQPFRLTVLILKGRRLADWATGLPERRDILLCAVKKGQDALLDLTLSLFPLTPHDLTRIRHLNRRVLLPTVRYLRALPDMASARTVIGPTIIPKPFSSLQKVLVYCMAAYCAYCELFHHTLAHNLRRGEPFDPKPLSVETRQAWIAAFVYVEPDPPPRCTCSCLPPHERALAEEVNRCRKMIHNSSCLILSLTIHRCILVLADEILNRLEVISDHPQFDHLEWGEIFAASGALRMLGVDLLKWLLATRGEPACSECPKEILATISDACVAALDLQVWTTLEADLQHLTNVLNPNLTEEGDM